MPSATRDIIVIGASAGGLDALKDLLAGLPSDLPATVFVVLHMGALSRLSAVLAKGSVLPVKDATSGESFLRGHVYVSVPGMHLMLHDHHILLRKGPRENHSRPAIDPLFRSAAASFGGRVIGVVLSGALSDGTAGLIAIKKCDGIAVVQDPNDALVSAMPASALRYAPVDHVSSAAAIGPLLGRLARTPAAPMVAIPLEVRLEAAIAAQELADMKIDDMLGRPSRFTCPECHGALWEIEDSSLLRYRCHVGHAYNADDMLICQNEEIDRLLGTLQRSHQERAALARRMSDHERTHGRGRLAEQLARRAKDYDDDAEIFKELIRNGVTDAEVVANSDPLDAGNEQKT